LIYFFISSLPRVVADIARKRCRVCNFVFFAQHVAENGKSGL
jgi:hypothetical protein